VGCLEPRAPCEKVCEVDIERLERLERLGRLEKKACCINDSLATITTRKWQPMA
jgi:hypothetical protein